MNTNSYEWAAHTADAQLIMHGVQEADLFQQGLLGVYEFMEPVTTEHQAPPVYIELRGRNMEQLLVDFLSNLVTWSYVNKAHYQRLIIHELTPHHFEAALEGNLVEQFGKDVKAVTYHHAQVTRVGDQFQAAVIFDI
jgi:SHS2 domain-containing protein